MGNTDQNPTVLDGLHLKNSLIAGSIWLAHHRAIINDMNVFPVPDGDTGNNMTLTLRRAIENSENVTSNRIDDVIDAFAYGALRGARGNSGTILSIFIRGLAKSLTDCDVVTMQRLYEAFQSAVKYVYESVSSVMTPVEGTILTVARLSVENTTVSETTTFTDLLADLLDNAKNALDKTPDLLPILREAGVKDSGGQGLVYFFEGILRFQLGEDIPDKDEAFTFDGSHIPTRNTLASSLPPSDEEGYGYDVQFLMLGEDLDVSQIRADISAMGWSPLVEGDSKLIKVHVHVYNPGIPLNYAFENGIMLDDIVVENMELQYQQLTQQSNGSELLTLATIAVANGEGITRIFKEYGTTRLIRGGQTMNPSTDDFLQAIESINAEHIIILPNNKNVYMTAQQVRELTSHPSITVLNTRNIPQGIIAMLTLADFSDQPDIDTLQQAIQERLQESIIAEITTATHSTTIENVQVEGNDYIGILQGKLISSHRDLSVVIHEIMERIDWQLHELVTLYYGENVTASDAEALVMQLQTAYPEIEFELLAGLQPLYPYLISIE